MPLRSGDDLDLDTDGGRLRVRDPSGGLRFEVPIGAGVQRALLAEDKSAIVVQRVGPASASAIPARLDVYATRDGALLATLDQGSIAPLREESDRALDTLRFAPSPDGTRVALWAERGGRRVVEVWAVAPRKRLWHASARRPEPFDVDPEWAPDGAHVAVTSEVFDAQTGARPRAAKGRWYMFRHFLDAERIVRRAPEPTGESEIVRLGDGVAEDKIDGLVVDHDPSGQLLLLSRMNHVAYLDRKTRREITLRAVDGAAKILKSGAFVAYASPDGITVMRVSDGASLSRRPSPTKRLAWLADGPFDGDGDELRELTFVARTGQRLPLEEVMARYFHPGLVPDFFAGRDFGLEARGGSP